MAVCNTNRAMAACQTNGFRDSQKTLDYTTLNHAAKEEIKAFLNNEDELHQIDDLTKVNPVTTVAVLKCLQARYAAGVFYTNAGCTLVGLNPFQSVPNLYSSEVMKEYHNVTRPQDLKPHIFMVAEQAFRNVQSHIEPVNQSLIVSGESGAGKTWTSRCLMNYFATVAASNSSIKGQENVERIEKRVLDSNPVMEAFGNASTLRNHNSSRFGKYIQLHLNRSQQLQGASVQTYLLEKTRVAYQAPHERNFHIFYQIVKGATEKQKSEWGLSEATEFRWLPNSEKVLEGIFLRLIFSFARHNFLFVNLGYGLTLSEEQFNETISAMLHLGIDHDTQLNVFRILVGLLHLGNVQFSFPVDDSYPCDLKAEAKSFLSTTANLLKISEEDLLEQIRIRTIVAGRQQQIFKKPCSKMECETRKDCVAKVIYAKLFDWLVNVISGSICSPSFGWTNFIGLLDVYGFESFPQNNLEQLCINYANEKLQQHFVAHYLKAQQEEYTSEGLEWSFINYQDNQRCLDLIEGSPTSIFSLLNEESRLNRNSDENQFKTRLQTALANNHCLSWDVFSKVPNFIVAHYAGKVNYQIEGMLEKNKDPVPPELVQLLQTSQDALLMELFPIEEKEHNDTKIQNKAFTVVSKFKSSLESLMHILNNTTPHYIRCIKPNMDCKPFLFRSEEIFAQLEACGLVETVSISAAGFPIRVPYQHFLERYGLLGRYNQANLQSIPSINGCFFTKKQEGALSTDGSSETLQSTVQDILTNVLTGQSVSSFQNPAVSGLCHTKVHCGKTKLFMNHDMLELLESARVQTLSNKALCIQHSWRKYCQRKLARSRRAATIIQAAIRSWLTRRWIKKLHHSAMVLQRAWKAQKIKMETLAEKELDNPAYFKDMELIPGSMCSSLSSLRHELLNKCSQSIPFQNLKLCSWPLGLILSRFCITGIALSAFEFLKACTRLAALKVKWSNTHKLEHNQCHRGIASIRALPEVQVKFHCKRSPLLFADTYPEHQKCTIIGFNQILLEKV